MLNPNKTPSFEWTHYLPQPAEPVEPPDLAALPIDSLAVGRALVERLRQEGCLTVADLVEFVEQHKDLEDWGLKAVGPKKRQEILDALAPLTVEAEPPATVAAGEQTARLIGGAFDVVARRCNVRMQYLDTMVGLHEGRPAVRIRWWGRSWHPLLERCARDDKHFHACPARSRGKDDAIEICIDEYRPKEPGAEGTDA